MAHGIDFHTSDFYSQSVFETFNLVVSIIALLFQLNSKNDKQIS